jgi:hypothetical protein
MTTPGVIWELLITSVDGETPREFFYADLARLFCEEIDEGEFGDYFGDFVDVTCELFSSLDMAGFIYIWCQIAFFITVLIHLVLTWLAISGRKLCSKGWLVFNASAILIFNLAAFLMWVVITEVWFGNDCQSASYLTDETDMCPENGLALALASTLLVLVQAILFISGILSINA